MNNLGKINIFEKTKIRRLTNEQQPAYEKAKISYICKKKFKQIYTNDKEYQRVRDNCHYTSKYRDVGHRIYSLKYSIPPIHVNFHK